MQRSTSSSPVPQWEHLRAIEFAPTPCPVCGSNDGVPKYEKRIRDMVMRYHICRRCKALYTNPRATVESLKNIYASKDFFAGSKPGGDHLNYSDFIAGEKYLRMTARSRLSRIARHKPTGRMLEIACAAGFFLIEAKNRGYAIEGIEISRPLAEYASKRWQVPVKAESVELADLPAGTFDVIASWGVLTIIRDPVALFRKIHRALKPGGIWAFNTYYHDGTFAHLFGKNWYILVVNTSQIYSRRLLLDLLDRAGFRLLSRRRDCPNTDLMKVADYLASSLRMPWLPGFLAKLGLARCIVRLPLPDVYEYICQKK